MVGISRPGERWNSGNLGDIDESEGRRRPASGDKNIIGNDSPTTKRNHDIDNAIAVVRLRHLNVQQPLTVHLVTKEQARKTWVLASKPSKTDAEYSFLRDTYESINRYGCTKIFNTPEAGIRYSSKVLASLIVNAVKDILGQFKLSLWGDVTPLNVEHTPANVRQDVHDIYKGAHKLLCDDAIQKGGKPASFDKFLDVIETVDPFAQLIRYEAETPNVEHGNDYVRHHPELGDAL